MFSILVNVPLLSKNDAPGSTTVANFAASLMKISCTTRNSSDTSRVVKCPAFPSCHAFRLPLLNFIGEATDSFHRLRALRAPPGNNKASVVEDEIRAGERVEMFMREAYTALQAGDRRLVGEKLIAAIQATRQALWLDIPEAVLQPLLDAQRTMMTAASVSGVSKEFLATEIEPMLAAHLPPGQTPEDALRFLRYLASQAHLQEIHFLWRPFLTDANDDMVLELAFAAGCRYVVTHNVNDFHGSEQLGVTAIRPREFLKLIRKQP